MIKDVAALVDGSVGDEVALGHAVRIARVFDANLTALYLNFVPEIVTSGAGIISPIAIEAVVDRSKIVGNTTAARLATRVAGLGVASSFRHVDALTSDLWEVLACASQAEDLMVVTHPSGHSDQREWRLVAEAALFGSARGVYFAGRQVHPNPTMRSVVVAWDGSRSATRALTEAVPFLQQAQRTLIVTIDGTHVPKLPDLPGDDLVTHLARLGITATYRRVRTLDRSVSSALVREIAAADGDLLVLGAYGHSRLRERIFGGVTRDFLANSPVALLMAH